MLYGLLKQLFRVGSTAKAHVSTLPEDTRDGVLFEKARQLHQSSQWPQAEAMYQQLLERHPSHPEVLLQLGMLHGQIGQFDKALDVLQRARIANPHGNALPGILGNVFKELGRNQEALSCYDQALLHEPNNAGLWCNRGAALRDLKQLDESLACLDHALQLMPNLAIALDNRGAVLRDLGRMTEAMDCHDRAVSADSQNALAHFNRGTTLTKLGREIEAIDSFDKSIRLDPRNANTYCNRGLALAQLRDYAEAAKSLQRAIQLQPGNALAHWNLSHTLLMLGEFAEGWMEFEWRWKLDEMKSKQRPVPPPRWLGKDHIAGKTVLLYNEQGLGDTLHFARYVPAVANLGARVFLEVQPSLTKLMHSLDGVDTIVSASTLVPNIDYQCPLLSLPLALATYGNVAHASPPYLQSTQITDTHWAQRLGKAKKPRVGVTWSGNPAHANDQNRSIPQRLLASLLEIDADWISVQKGARSAMEELPPNWHRLRHFDDALTDFEQTAGLINQLDILVSVDTSVAHLAGAMGKPVWILLPFNPDWRWGLERADSPLYPSARLWRQCEPGNWPELLARVASALLQKFDSLGN